MLRYGSMESFAVLLRLQAPEAPQHRPRDGGQETRLPRRLAPVFECQQKTGVRGGVNFMPLLFFSSLIYILLRTQLLTPVQDVEQQILLMDLGPMYP